MLNYALVVPVLNGGNKWQQAAQQIAKQHNGPQKVLVIDSGSTDDSIKVSQTHEFELLQIHQTDFDHGGTRQLAVDALKGFEFIAFMTQDAILDTEQDLYKLLEPFADPEVAVVYGRQLPHFKAGAIEAHARLFNYPSQSVAKTKQDIKRLGIKAAFCSNSFAAYRRKHLLMVGGFPQKSAFAEDMLVAAKLILKGKKVFYNADAKCRHSHALSLQQEYQRAFYIGRFHSQNPWLLEQFGSAEQEGKQFVLSQLHFLLWKNIWLIPSSLIRVILKYMGYKMGQNHAKLGAKQRLWPLEKR